MAKVRFTQSDFRILCALHNLSERKKRRKKVTLGSRSGSRFFTITSLWVMFSLSTLYLKTVDWSLTTRMQQWERNVVLCWAGVCGEERNTSSPKNACVGGYIKGAMSHIVHVHNEALHIENIHQLFQVLRVIQCQEFIVLYLSHPLTVRRVIRPLLLYSPFRRFHCVFVSITVCTLINGLFEVNCLTVTKCPLIEAAGQEVATRKSSPKTQRSFSLGGRLVKGFCWMEQFSYLGFLRGSSADMTMIFFFYVFIVRR